MANDSTFQNVLVKKPKRARFDFSHGNTFGMKIGYAYPTEVRYIVPGDDVAVSMNQVARLAPMPVPTFADLKVRHDWFFVPCRLMYNERDMTKVFGSVGSGYAQQRYSCSLLDFSSAFSGDYRDIHLPADPDNPTSAEIATLKADISKLGDLYLPGSLFDFLGYPVPDDINFPVAQELYDIEATYQAYMTTDKASDLIAFGTALRDFYSDFSQVTSAEFNIEPLLAYHYIWRDWYRFVGIEDQNVVEPYLENHVLSSLYSKDLWPGGDNDFTASTSASTVLDSDYLNQVGGVSFGALLGRLRQVHLSKDMFTSVRYGSKPTVLIPSGAGADIPALREASAIQRFIDLVSVVGQRYYDKVKALFNVKAEGFADDRVQFLARYQQFIKIGEVLTTATTSEATTGDYAGRGILIDGKYLFKRYFSEPGWLMCITSIVPDIAYIGASRQLTDVYAVDTPVPSLSEIGDQTVFNREVNFTFHDAINNDLSFGDQFRYYAYKSAPSEVHGSFRMKTMRPWVPTQDIYHFSGFDVIGYSKVNPTFWNKFFNDTSSTPIFGDRFFFKIDFTEFITRQLPKYLNYHL